MDTRTDDGWADAQKRAARWLTGDLAGDLTSRAREGRAWRSWQHLTERDAWTSVQVTDVTPGGGEASGLSTTRVERVVITTHDGTGATISTRTIRLGLTLHRRTTQDPWRVAGIQAH